MKSRGKRIFSAFIILLLIVPAITAVVMFKLNMFNVKHIEIVGNSQFSKSEISNHILSDKYCRYAPYMYFKYRWLKPEKMPFMADVKIYMTGINTVKIEVKEKPIVAYAEHLGSRLFFDSDGIIVESSDRLIDGIVKLEGLEFQSYKLYERPQLNNPIILDSLSGIVKHLNKYGLSPDSLYVNGRGEIDLKFSELTVKLGMEDCLDEKIARLSAILPMLDEKNGILKLNAYRQKGDSIVYVGKDRSA